MLRLPVISIALLSAAALAYELLLMRLFSIIHWHHFAYMVIGLALLGHGFSGSVVMVLQRRLLKHFRYVYFASILLFTLFCVISFQGAQNLPFNAEEILWDWRQSLYLLLMFLLLSVPFFFVGAAICLAFLSYKHRMAKLYAADLFGAGAGCLGFVLLMYAVFPQTALFYIALGGLLSATVAGLELRINKADLSIVFLLMLAMLGWGGGQLQLKISPYKSLPRMQLINGIRVIAEKSSPLGLITVLASDQVPIRYAPGMSFSSGSEPLPQLGVFTDADNMGVITANPDHRRQLDYLDQMSSALPYHLQQAERVLIIGSGSGSDLLQAQFHRVGQIDAVELNPHYLELTGLHDRDFVSDVYQQTNVSAYIADGRDFLNTHKQQYDLIQLTLLDSFNAAAAGLYALNESYLYTVEALQLYLSKLQPGGYLSITRWAKIPPRDTLKLFNTALTVLQKNGNAKQQLLLIRSWQTATLIIKNGAFSHEEIAAAELFCSERNFDLVYTPEIRAEQANRYNVLSPPLFYQGTQALLSRDRKKFVEDYKFNLKPATDDQPYFQHFFRWSALPEMLSLLGKGGASLIETGYLIIFATLCIAVLTSILLIMGPLWWLRHTMKRGARYSVRRRDVFGYFCAIGLGFMMIEIAVMQKFILFLHHPVYAAAATLTAFLVFAGLGSAHSSRLSQRYGRYAGVSIAVIGIVAFSASYLLILPGLFAWGSDMMMVTRFLLAIMLIAPLAFCMGMPMPLALDSLADHADQLIPWAWAINGCASVISSVLTALLAMQFGFSSVIIAALLLYAAVLLMFPGPGRSAAAVN
ncbi:SAM-dependent methyltransferase [Methylomarinum sp. Ch1-1]|uniref:SAM-dependent methyltransferase n=1 Tax=Methylomarinum roseum TaxID=3067653 RepID=A0AAU7NU01_9GAMM|nr:SAM-dependent methyltransferase [Methylomarinum sp. Ch1-1]MDP4519528.1 SAM-dependent methyltransferase [Methylomarinum sp. Ch1-1]